MYFFFKFLIVYLLLAELGLRCFEAAQLAELGVLLQQWGVFLFLPAHALLMEVPSPAVGRRLWVCGLR